MKKTLLGLLVLIPLAGCASSGPAYGPVYSAGGFYDDCLYSDYCYDGFSRYNNYYYGYGYSTNSSTELQRAKIERLKRSGSTRVVTRSDGGRPAASASSRSVSAPRSSSSRSTTSVAPRGGSSHSSSHSSSHASHGGSHR